MVSLPKREREGGGREGGRGRVGWLVCIMFNVQRTGRVISRLGREGKRGRERKGEGGRGTERQTDRQREREGDREKARGIWAE